MKHKRYVLIHLTFTIYLLETLCYALYKFNTHLILTYSSSKRKSRSERVSSLPVRVEGLGCLPRLASSPNPCKFFLLHH